MIKINTKELVESLSYNIEDLSVNEAKNIINTLISLIISKVKENELVKINGLGTFCQKERKERQGFNPRTREKITIPAYKAVKFKVSAKFKKAVRT